MQIRLHGISWGKCNSNSNYITLTQIKIIGTHFTKFRKTHNATPQHDTFKTPRQASPNLSNFGNTGSTSAVPLSRFEAWRAPYMSIYGYTVMEQPVARDLFQSRKKCVRGKKMFMSGAFRLRVSQQFRAFPHKFHKLFTIVPPSSRCDKAAV